MSILNIYWDKKCAANERRDKELIRRTINKNPEIVMDTVQSEVDFYNSLMSSLQDIGSPPYHIRANINHLMSSMNTNLGIDVYEQASDFANAWRPSDEDLVDFIHEYFKKLEMNRQPGGNYDLPDEQYERIVNKKTDGIWNSLVSNKTGKRYSNQILLWWSRKSTAQDLREDLDVIEDSIKMFEKHKKNLDKENISQYKKWTDLNEALEPIRIAEAADNRNLRLNTGETVFGGKEEDISKLFDPKQQLLPGMPEELSESSNIVIKKINSFEEAKTLGEGTTWCFTKSPHYYKQYHNNGPLYTVLENGDPKVGIGLYSDGEGMGIEIKNSNNRSLTENEKTIYGDYIVKIKNSQEVQEALEVGETGERILGYCDYCVEEYGGNGEIMSYDTYDDYAPYMEDVGDVCTNHFSAYGCQLSSYEHPWVYPNGNFHNPMDEETGNLYDSCFDCTKGEGYATACIICNDLMKFSDYQELLSHTDSEYFDPISEYLCFDCSVTCDECGEQEPYAGEKPAEYICKNCRQGEFPSEPMFEQPGSTWEAEFGKWEGDPELSSRIFPL